MLLSMVLCLLTLLVQFSTADMVTITPSEAEPVTDIVSTTEKIKVKPTIRTLHITSNVKYRYAQTLVSCRVVNPSDSAGEAHFFVTLPETAFISDFNMETKGQVYKAYVKEKEEAKAVYDQAVQTGQFAGHVALDARDSNQFTVSVNIEAQGKVTFNLTYEQLLHRKLGVYSNIININPQQVVTNMWIKVNIEEPSAITTLEVPELQTSNEAIPDKSKQNALAKIEEISINHKQVFWAPTPEQQKKNNSTGLNGQFVVNYDVDREKNPQQILVDEGYFVHFYAPENLPKLKKHIIFVLDYSGSMAGRKIEQLKDAMDKILAELDPNDYFSIVMFHSYILAWSPERTYSTSTEYLSRWEMERMPANSINSTLNHDFVVPVTPTNIDLARYYLGNYSDLGATNIMGGLRTGLELVNIGSELWMNESDSPQPVMVFLTDGQPNVEEYNTDNIINNTKHLNTKECPIFSLAFGYGADLNFLRKLSLSNYGFARTIYEAADASDQLTNFYQTVSSPLLSNVTFTYLPGQVDNSSNTQTGFPVYFRGSELVVAGKINKEAVKDNETIGELTGVTANGFHKYPIIIDISGKPENRNLGHLEKTWAYLTIQQLLDKSDALDNGDEKNQTKGKALQLALQYSFVTPLTSLVVVKPNETESAVDTTQLKPGSEVGQFPAYASSAAIGAGFGGAPQLPLSAGQFMLPAALPPPPPMGMYQSSGNHPIAAQGPQPLDTLMPTPPVYPTKRKVPLSDIKWLQQFLTNSSSSGNITVIVQGHQYNLALNETDQPLGVCQVNNTSGECYHFPYCALSIFQDDVSDFIPYQCTITGDFLGVCCPGNLN